MKWILDDIISNDKLPSDKLLAHVGSTTKYQYKFTYATNQGDLNILNLATSIKYSSVGLINLFLHLNDIKNKG